MKIAYRLLTSMNIMKSLVIVCVIILSFSHLNAQTAGPKKKDAMKSLFAAPPDGAKPRVWWHWMNGNITKEGIRKDLEWMHRSGIGGVQNFDAAMETPQMVEKRLVYMTPEWNDAFGFAAKLADSLKLEMAVAGSPGWSETGGAWVTVEDGMKKIVWTETRVNSGQQNIKLPKAPASSGRFQNMQLDHFLSNGDEEKLPTLYRDVAVISFPVPEDELSVAALRPEVSSSGGAFTLAQLTDSDLDSAIMLPADSVSGFGWISFKFDDSVKIQAISIVGGGDRGFLGRNGDLQDTRALEASEDGKNWKRIAYLPAGENLQQTFSIPQTTARFFRVTIKNLPGNRQERYPGTPVSEIMLYTGSRVHHFEDKAGFAPAPAMLYQDAPEGSHAIDSARVIDLTSKMRADGTLDWTPPAGNWCILRYGYTVMGVTNHPATKEATGFEVDKMDPAAIRRYFNTYLGMYKKASGGLMGKKGGLQYMVTDSWEAGAQNWTPNMFAEFRRRRGYDLQPWMPALSGFVLGSAETTDRFLFDFRKTISEMVAEYHYDQLTNILDSVGMKRYTESHESGRAIIADGMDVKRSAAVPMSAMWTPNPIINKNDQTTYLSDIRESASVAHIYGQNIVAAESLTALGYPEMAWIYCPENLKPTADLELACGLNRFVIHCSPHQPSDSLFPGVGLGPFGQWYTRHETWAGQAYAWNTYLARSSYLLQQGKFVADIVYYYGEDDNITSIFKTKQPAIPEGYNYDFINSHALLNLLSVKNGQLVTPSGMKYRLLVLDSNARRMPLAVLKKIHALVKAGATVAGVRPERSTGLYDDEQLFQQLVDEIFKSSYPGVFTGMPLKEALDKMGVAPDFAYTKPLAGTRLLFVHRALKDRDLYWVNSRNQEAQLVDVDFRITGKVPEVWDPATGGSRPVSYTINKNTTTVKLSLDPHEALFVIFKEKAKVSSYMIATPTTKDVDNIQGSWQVNFQEDRGAPSSAIFDSLYSFTEHDDPGIKYFSGTASYTRTITVQPEWINTNHSLLLDLGSVKNIAEVFVNGQSCGVLWKKPFQADISKAVHAGQNTLEIKVTSLWVNRLIGDQQPDVTKKITWTANQFYSAQSQLLPSGLLGPVRLISKTTE